MYSPSFTESQSLYSMGDAQLEADLARWEQQQASAPDWLEDRITTKARVKKLFQAEMLHTTHLAAKAMFAPPYRDVRNDEMIYPSFAELFQGEMDYEGMNELLTALVIQQVKAGNRLAQRIFVKASQTFASSNTTN